MDSLIISLQTLFSDSQTFEPHITISSDIILENNNDVTLILRSALAAINSLNDIRKKKMADAAASSTTPNEELSERLISFDKLQFGKKYFRKVNITINKNANLVSLARIIREYFVEFPRLKALKVPTDQIDKLAMENANNWALNEFEPHLSLAYSNKYTINPALEKTILTRIEDMLNISVLSDDGTILDNSNMIEFPADGLLKLVKCEGPVNEWVVLGSLDYHLLK